MIPRTRSLSVALLAAALILVRAWIGAALWSPVYSALTWDDFTRVLIAWNWPSDPFVSADIVWLPAQTWLLGALFWLTGDAFSANPMALVAIMNTGLIVGTSILTGLTARRLSGATSGGFLAFTLVLFSPWGFYTANAGLAEPLYYLAVSLAMLGLVGFHDTGSRRAALWGALGVGLAAATRYEGWWLAVAWAGGMTWSFVRRSGRPNLRAALAGLWPVALPFFVPAAWLLYNLAVTGSPTTFVTRSAEYFTSAFGGPPTVLGRILYYPSALVRADLLLLTTTLVLGWSKRRLPAVRLMFGTVTVHGALFVGTSLIGSAVGAFNERFMFSFILAVTPVTGFIPELIQRVGDRARVLVVGTAFAVLFAVTAYRIYDRPIEWSHAPDLLALAEGVVGIAESEETLHLSIDPAMAGVAATPLAVVGGDRIQVTVDEAAPDNAALRVDELPRSPTPDDSPVRFGRYVVTGRRAVELDGLDDAECLCEGWILTDEAGSEFVQGEPSLGWSRFSATDPPPDSVTRLTTRLEPGLGQVVFEVRSLYGHGFNPGRIRVSVLVDGAEVAGWDLSAPSRWRRILVDSAPEGSMVEVRLETLAGIESGWGWGDASTVLVRNVEDVPG